MPSHSAPSPATTALVLGGGGARGAYQAGVLRAIGRRHPGLDIPVLTGISAGAINTAFLAAHDDTLAAATEALVQMWLAITPAQVYRVDAASLASNVLKWGWRLGTGGMGTSGTGSHSLVDTAPLARFLHNALSRSADGAMNGIERNIASGRLRAVALSATSYSTGQSVTWVEARDIAMWQRPQRRTEQTRLRIEHVLASSALPLIFPAVKVGEEWYGDGGIRLTAPLSPALHLGASRILTISTRHARSRAEADVAQIRGYPPPAQVLGVLYNAIFLDLIDQDIHRLQVMNRLLATMTEAQRGAMREVDILVLRPSRDLGQLARQYEPRLPTALRFLTRGWGTRRTSSADLLSLAMFQEDYVRALVELGEEDATTQMEQIDAFLGAAGPARVLREA